MRTYILSWFRTDRVPSFVYPRWWQFWRQAEVCFSDARVRHCVTHIQQDEADVLLAGDWSTPTKRLLRKVMGPGAGMVQLEDDVHSAGRAMNYIPTSDPPSEVRFTGEKRAGNNS